MRFIPTEDEVMLRDAARRFLADDGREKGADWQSFAAMGWLMAAIPEEHGGLGLGHHAAAVVAEELGRAASPAPFVEVAITAAQVCMELAPDRLAAIMAGERRIVLAHAELEARGDPAWCATRAEPAKDGFRLTGSKTAVIGAPEADELLVSANVPGKGVTLFSLPAPLPMLSYLTVDGRSAADITFDALFVPEAAVLGGGGGALPAIERAIDHALVLHAADMVGAMQGALDMTRDYLLIRKQYGTIIGDFQALRHRLADMFIETEQARSMVLRGLDGLERPSRARAALAAATKAHVARAGKFVTGQAVQLHGGIGVTEEYPVGRYFNRAVVYDARSGSADTHVGRFARLTTE